jgi:hypothetical protein
MVKIKECKHQIPLSFEEVVKCRICGKEIFQDEKTCMLNKSLYEGLKDIASDISSGKPFGSILAKHIGGKPEKW